MKIGLLPSTQWTSVGNGIAGHVEAELAQDVTARLVPKLQAAGHTVRIFAGSTDANTDGAHNCVSWGADVAISLHLDSASGTPAALLCYQESRSLPMGLALLHYYCQAMGIHDKGGMIRVPGQNGVAVLRIPEGAGIPAALLECGDMNRPDGPNWTQEAHREKAAQALAVAITTVFGGAIPQTKPREETVLYQGSSYHSTDKKTFTFLDCWMKENDYWFKTVGPATNLRFKLTQRSGLEHITAPQTVDGIHDHNMQTIAAQKPMTDSYVLTVTSDTPVSMSLREVPK